MKKMLFTIAFSLCCFLCFAQLPAQTKQKVNKNVAITNSQKAKLQNLHTQLTKLLDAQLVQLKQAEANASKIEELRRKLDQAQKEAQSEDKLGNFEIQRLMSSFNEAQTLASSILKKASDTNTGVIGKIN